MAFRKNTVRVSSALVRGFCCHPARDRLRTPPPRRLWKVAV